MSLVRNRNFWIGLVIVALAIAPMLAGNFTVSLNAAATPANYTLCAG